MHALMHEYKNAHHGKNRGLTPHFKDLFFFFHRNGHTGKIEVKGGFSADAVTRCWKWARTKIIPQKKSLELLVSSSCLAIG